MARSINKLTRALPDFRVMQALIERIHLGSDREIAILSGAAIDFALLWLMLARFDRIETKEEYEKLFGERGPAGSLGSKLLLGFHLGLLSRGLSDNLTCINRIRNAFAHAIVDVSFETPQIVDEVRLLKITKEFHKEFPESDDHVGQFSYLISDDVPGTVDGGLYLVDTNGALIAGLPRTKECGVKDYGDLLRGPPAEIVEETAKITYIRSVKLCYAVVMMRIVSLKRNNAHFEVARRL